MSRPKPVEGDAPSANTLAIGTRRMRKKKTQIAAGRFPLLSGFLFLLGLPLSGLSDTDESAAHCS